MIEAFLIKPFLAIILIAAICAILGVFSLWKKLAYFGDGLSHAMLLGFILGAMLDVNHILITILFAIFFAALIGLIGKTRHFSKDTLIAIISYFCISVAIILNGIFVKNINLNSYIFGDVLIINDQELLALTIIAATAIIYAIFAFKKILLININQDLATIAGIKTNFWNLSFLILLAIAIAISVKIVGILLMTALLILPAAIARIFSTSPKQMMFLSLIFSCLAAVFSFNLANKYDVTISSVTIATLSSSFILGLFIKKLLNTCLRKNPL